MKLAEKLVLQRKQKGLSQVQLAETIHVTRQAVSRWEVGDAVPSMDNLKRISELYALPMEYFLNDDTEEPTAQTVPVGKTDHNYQQVKHQKRKKLWITLVVVLSLLIITLIVVTGKIGRPSGVSPIDEIAETTVSSSWGSDFDLEW